MKRLLLVVSLALAFTVRAWDVEHDVLALLVGEHLPAEIKSFFTFDDFDTLISHCHFPDMTEYAPRHFRTLDEIAAVVGERDRAVIASRRFHGYWMHTEDGKATLMTLLARAFARGEHRNAAFYLSVLTHPVGDESALNHPPLLNFIRYCEIGGVDFGLKKVEPGAKNVFGFRSDGGVVKTVREKLKGYRPRLPPAEGFREQVLWHCVQVVPQSVYAAEHEAKICLGRSPDPAGALADLVAMQVRALVDIAWTCWVNRAADAPLPAADFADRFARETKALEAESSPARQDVFGDLFDPSLDPKDPKGTVGVLCESVGFRGAGVQSYVDRIVSGAAGRTLRDHGWAVKGISLRHLKPDGLRVSETPVVFAAMGNARPSAAAAVALIAFRRAGGRLLYVSGQDPVVGHARTASGRAFALEHGDPQDVSGFRDLLSERASDEVPASPGWAKEGACADWRRLALEIGGTRHPLRHDPNGDGWSKAACAEEIRVADGVTPIAWLDNGTNRFCVAARRGNVTWLPVYMLSPFLFSDDTKLDFGALRLDSFATKVLLDELSPSPAPTGTVASAVVPFREIGRIAPRSAREIRASNWTIGCETIERGYAEFDNYKAYLGPLGLKKARLQCGWARCERTRGAFDFAWLDAVVDYLKGVGIEPILETSYGNPIYKGAGGKDLGAQLPHTEEGLAAWDRWIETLVTHFRDRVRIWAMWNEPDLAKNNSAEATVAFNVRTAKLIRRLQPDAEIQGLSLAMTNAQKFENHLKCMGEDYRLFDRFVYHGYLPNPDAADGNVRAMMKLVAKYAPGVRLRQGENGAPSAPVKKFALSGIPWTEVSQAKWDMRRMLWDLGHGIESSVFTICDFNHVGREMNVKGLLRARPDHTVVGPKLAYRAVQNVAAVFDDGMKLDETAKLSCGERGVALYRYDGKAPLFVFWTYGINARNRPDHTVAPGDSLQTHPIAIACPSAAPLEDPVWVDLLSGRIFAYPKEKESVTAEGTVFRDVPVYDSPCLLTERRLFAPSPGGFATRQASAR